jgi:hypothetical protein
VSIERPGRNNGWVFSLLRQFVLFPELFFFVLAHLHAEIALVAKFFDQVKLGFEKVDVPLFIF